MKKDYFALWSILAVAFAIFFLLSTCDEIRIPQIRLKSSGLAEAVLGKDSIAAKQDTVVPALTADTLRADTTVSANAERPDSNLVVLFIGDSMVECLGPRFAAYCEESGHKLYTVIWYSSTTERYGESKLLTRYIKQLNPDYILLSLGGNELFIRDIVDKRDKYVKSILAEIGDIPYLWIGPPNWKKDTGINRLIASNVPPGCMFVSEGIKLGRKKDGAHPDAESSVVWMDSIVSWMPDSARHKLQLDRPAKKTGRPHKQYTHKPGDKPE